MDTKRFMKIAAMNYEKIKKYFKQNIEDQVEKALSRFEELYPMAEKIYTNYHLKLNKTYSPFVAHK